MNKFSMKKYTIGFLALMLGVVSVASAQSMMNPTTSPQDNHAKEEEAKGKELLGKLQSNQIQCGDLSDDDFDSIGEYFMGLMHGDSHDAMNARITQMIGKEGEEQMHIAMGKRMSGCDPSAVYPMGENNFMMPIMGGQRGMGEGGNFYGRMMTGRYMQSDGIELLSMIVWWGVLIVMMVMLYRLVSGHRSAVRGHSSPMEVLKERYAKGEIDKEEFHDKKKDLI